MILQARKDFPIFDGLVNGKKLVYLDNAATTLKPKQVVDRIAQYYLYESSNVHRGIHYLSNLGTENFEKSRKAIRDYIGASSEEEIIFNKGTTDAVNFIAQAYGWQYLKDGDEILISEVEHHSNIVPWQILAERKGVKLKTFPIADTQDETYANFEKALTSKTRIVSVVQISNTLGLIFPVEQICRKAREMGALSVVDGAQAVAHTQVDVQKMGCDFFMFSAHKLYGPTGFGVLYGRKDILSKLNPYQGGGGIIDAVTFEKTTFIDVPFRFEPGTPHIEGAIGLHAAINYVKGLGLSQIAEHENTLTDQLYKKLQDIPQVQIYGPRKNRSAIVSFNVKGAHPSDVGSLLDGYGIAVRTGHHCTQPLMRKLQVPGTVRASFGVYNTQEEIEFFVESLLKVINILKV